MRPAPPRCNAGSGWRRGRSPTWGCSEAQLDEHRADLEAHRRFSGLLSRRRDSSGRSRIHSIAGEPRFGAGGVFLGYWGVARDVTEEVRTQRAMSASETRYRELFDRSPSPLLLHRKGLIFDANDAAARLFGFADPAGMNGFAIVDLFSAGENARAHRRAPVGARADAGRRRHPGHRLPDPLDRRPARSSSRPPQCASTPRPGRRRSRSCSTSPRASVSRPRCGAPRRCCRSCSRPAPTTSRCPSSTSGRHALVNAAFTRLTGHSSDRSGRPQRRRSRPLERPEGPRPAARADRPAWPRHRPAGRDPHQGRRASSRCACRLRASRWTSATTS